MVKNTVEKSLVKINKNSIFSKIKQFFKNLFSKNETVFTDVSAASNNIIISDEDKRNTFVEKIKNIEDEETILLKLQRKYRNGEIKEEDLTEEQINFLCKLYDKQISNFKKSNEIKKQKILEYKKRLQIDN